MFHPLCNIQFHHSTPSVLPLCIQRPATSWNGELPLAEQAVNGEVADNR